MDLDLSSLLTPVSEDNPSGESLEYDPSYMALEALATGVPATEMGESVSEGKDPDFRKLQSECVKLWERTRDLRLACYLAISGLPMDGLKGFADGLETIKYLLENQWESFWPQLDPDDDNDPTERINILHMISPDIGAYDDPIHFINLFRNVRLAPIGPKYTLRDLMIAENELEVSDTKIDPALFNAEMGSVSPDVYTAQNALVERCIDLLTACQTAFDEKAPDYSISVVSISNELKRLKKFYAKYTSVGISAVAEVTEQDGAVGGDAPATAGRPQATVFDLQSYKPQTRQEALLMLQKSADYFVSAEPNSPLPYLLNRAVRLANMNFMELLSELTPDAVDRGRDILGVRQSDSND